MAQLEVIFAVFVLPTVVAWYWLRKEVMPHVILIGL
jgi:hypothetical protein